MVVDDLDEGRSWIYSTVCISGTEGNDWKLIAPARVLDTIGHQVLGTPGMKTCLFWLAPLMLIPLVTMRPIDF